MPLLLTLFDRQQRNLGAGAMNAVADGLIALFQDFETIGPLQQVGCSSLR